MFAAHREAVAAALAEICDAIQSALDAQAEALGPMEPMRLYGMLADGTDQMVADMALARKWEVIAPLPFGRALYRAVASRAHDLDDVRALLEGRLPADPHVLARARMLDRSFDTVRLFEMAERDDDIGDALLAMLADPGSMTKAQGFAALSAERVALAARVMIEQADIVIAVWDGVNRSLVGGTGHTIAKVLEQHGVVICIHPSAPSDWRIMRSSEALISCPPAEDRMAALSRIIRSALRPGTDIMPPARTTGLQDEAWPLRSHPLSGGYRRIEAMFAGEGRPFRSLVQRYEPPEAVAAGSGARLLADIRALPRLGGGFADAVERSLLRRFAWADGISTHLSDAYRGGMVANFLLSSLAIAAGIAYQPLGAQKWPFAGIEFILLAAIILITWRGVRQRWHSRWFTTRRVAEYLRHAPILLALGVARPPGRWPQGIYTSWPEYYARAALRDVGLPTAPITRDYLRRAMTNLLGRHVVEQRDYHVEKARRLRHVHHSLDRMSETLFILAVMSVSTYLLIEIGAAAGLIAEELPHATSKLFTFLGVSFPTFGAAIAGIRYFGDFERFSAISRITAERLDGLDQRIGMLAADQEAMIDYAVVADLAHEMDSIVVSEIESWQAVFAGKQITVPV
ncbi:hypothetical protein DM806_00720 [Sphingobium lactosutens]|nr:hypothetical protein [Sphingobium lactosutens]